MPIVHAIRILHKDIYCIAGKFAKRDKLGIHQTVEKATIEILSLAIEGAFRSKETKRPVLESLRVKTEILKNLIRTENEMQIIDMKTYVRLSGQLIEISKMTSGWINYLTQKEPS